MENRGRKAGSRTPNSRRVARWRSRWASSRTSNSARHRKTGRRRLASPRPRPAEASASLLEFHRRRAHHAKLSVFDQSHRHRRQEFTHHALVEEARAEFAGQQEIPDERQDAAGEIYAAAGLEHDREVAREAAEHRAKH